MNIAVSQIYIEAGASFPFSYRFQNYLGRELSNMVLATPRFIERLGADWRAIFRISAKSSLETTELRGPTLFRKAKDVEYTIFLPYAPLLAEMQKTISHVATIRAIVVGIGNALDLLGLEGEPVRNRADEFAKEILKDNSMLEPS